MYINIGGEQLVERNKIIAVFDIDKVTTDKITREYLRAAEEKKSVISLSEEIPKSFIVVKKKEKEEVYISPLLVQTITKRMQREEL